MLEVTRKDSEAIHLVYSGDLTIYESSSMKRVVAEATTEASIVEIDLASVSAIDTAGLQLLLVLQKECSNRGRRLSIVNPAECVVDIMLLFNATDLAAAITHKEAFGE